MGTDIHGVLQTKFSVDGNWFTECHMENDRNYKLFAALADVRNGHGFASVYTHEPIRTLSSPRGWPEDFSLESLKWLGSWDGDEDPWLGEHSFSWLGLEEMTSWDGWDQTLRQGGVIPRAKYEEWDPSGPPRNGWCGMIHGPGITVVDSRDSGWQATPDWTHVRVYWERPLRESVGTFLAWLDYAKGKTEGQEARIVFGFDS